MKRILPFALALFMLFAVLSTSVCADQAGELSAYLLDGEVKNGEVITIRFELNGLADTTGAVLVENKYYFDESALEFVSLSANHPEGWDFEGEVAEDWSALCPTEEDSANDAKYIYHCIFNPMLDNMIKEDHVLYIDVKFKVLDQSKEIKFDAKECYWSSFDQATNDFPRFELQDKTFGLSDAPEADGGFPWWIVGIAGGAVVIAGGVIACVLAKKKKKEA